MAFRLSSLVKALKARFFISREDIAEWLSGVVGKKIGTTEKTGVVEPLETVYIVEEREDLGIWAVHMESSRVYRG